MKRMKRTVVLLVSLLVLVGAAVGGTLAWMTAQTDPVVNKFEPANVSTEVKENFDGTTKSNVYIENTGNVDAYIRAAVVITWQDAKGNVYGTVPVKGTDYTITDPSNTSWVTGDDGFYYHKSPVKAGESTGVLIEKCEAVEGKAPDGYTLHVEILGSGIQSLPCTAFNKAWGTSSGLKAESDGANLTTASTSSD